MPPLEHPSDLATDIRWIKQALQALSEKFEKFEKEYVRREEYQHVVARLDRLEESRDRFRNFMFYTVIALAMGAFILLLSLHPEALQIRSIPSIPR